MNNNNGYGFIGGFLLGGIVGAAAALLMAPASGKETREQIRAEGVALENRAQEFGDDTMRQARKMVKQGQKGVTDAQARTTHALEEQKLRLTEAIDASKQAASQRKDEMVNRFEDVKANAKN
ncbi:MAG TPA: YtxH domain-containing protein [Anaerolineae bacterium]|nr:YtxH domain-containing protein [Anaerolineae bacterium]